jgi:hypothetical protein
VVTAHPSGFFAEEYQLIRKESNLICAGTKPTGQFMRYGYREYIRQVRESSGPSINEEMRGMRAGSLRARIDIDMA